MIQCLLALAVAILSVSVASAGTYTVTFTDVQEAEITALVSEENAKRAARQCFRDEAQNPDTKAWVLVTDASVQPSWGRRQVQYNCSEPAITNADLVQSRAGQIARDAIRQRNEALKVKCFAQPCTDSEKARVQGMMR